MQSPFPPAKAENLHALENLEVPPLVMSDRTQDAWVQCDMLLDLALLGLNTVLQFNSFENRYGCI